MMNKLRLVALLLGLLIFVYRIISVCIQTFSRTSSSNDAIFHPHYIVGPEEDYTHNIFLYTVHL